jgi:hypothetical protein
LVSGTLSEITPFSGTVSGVPVGSPDAASTPNAIKMIDVVARLLADSR